MFRLTFITMLLITLLGAAQEKYASSTGKYAAVFPGKPTESEQVVDTPIGKLTMHLAGYAAKNDLGFMTIYNEYPPAVSAEKPQSVLARTRDGTKGPDGKVLDDKEITLGADKVPGREYLLAKGDDRYLRARVYLKGSRLYQVIVSGTKKEDVTSKEADKFLDSFEFAK